MQPVGMPSYTSNVQQPSFDLEGMLKKAQEFSENKAEKFSVRADLISNYINKILNDEEFQSNPRDYLDAWRFRRGKAENFRIPEDLALSFFNTYFRF